MTSDESDLTSGDGSSDAERRRRKKHCHQRRLLLEVKHFIKDIKRDEKVRNKKFVSGKKNQRSHSKGEQPTMDNQTDRLKKRGKSIKKRIE